MAPAREDAARNARDDPMNKVTASFRHLTTADGHEIRWSPLLCKSCQLCVAFCPRGVLALDDELAVTPSNPDACTGCRLCEQLCPDFAIEVDRSPRAAAGGDRRPALDREPDERGAR